MKSKYISKLFLSLVGSAFLLMSCEKEDAMVVDRVVSPVLVTVAGSSFTAAEPVNLSATIYELNKSGLLNHEVGIDSIPLSNLAIKVKLNATTLADLTTDQAGKIILFKTWSELGLAAPKAGNTVNIEFSGSHKGQAFTKSARVQVK
ncbi:hypothetical protein AAE02nite_38960 [Adhaeribacter aerolatus]|uniref:DUF4625 domain-containing protein n=1 Tax=Adhaeribacter aerolatus TaxID=670289 RepID=A0A512B2N6_9BACT|nr:hypothetical protein [Adhaeribacter aerolatus]GEO06232.1 hypothetical protein AAE02nite_38960 [Adhaeribacter aerolatus]